ncbi:MAG: flippase [Candidatus Hadarchaeaceae archaeon]
MPDAEEYARRLVKGSITVFVALIVSQFVAFLLRMFLTRALTVEEYGLFYAVFTFVSFFGLFRELGFGSSLAKHIPEFRVRGDLDKIKSSIVFTLCLNGTLSLFIGGVMVLLSGQIAEGFFRMGAATSVIQILAVWFFVMIFLNFLSVFQGFQDMSAYSLLQFLRNFLVLIMAVVMVGYLGFRVDGVALAYLVELSAVAVLAFVILRRRHPSIFGGKVSITKPLVKELSLFALPVFVGGLGSLIISYMDTLMITGFRTLSEVGFYQVAQPVAHFLWYLPTALVTVFFPMVSEFWARREKELLGGALTILVKFSFIAILPLTMIFIAFPEIVINMLFGPSYLAGVVAMQILSITAVPYTLFMILSSTVQGIGEPLISTKVVSAIAVFNLVGNLILIPTYGIDGAAVATFFSYLLGMLLLFRYSKRIIKFKASASSILKTACGGLLTLLLVLCLKRVIELPPWTEAFIVVAISFLFYTWWILITKALTKEDLKLVARIISMPRWLLKVAGKIVGE